MRVIRSQKTVEQIPEIKRTTTIIKLNENQDDLEFLKNPIDLRSMEISESQKINDSKLDFSKPLSESAGLEHREKVTRRQTKIRFLLNEMKPREPEKEPKRKNFHPVIDIKKDTQTKWTPEIAIGVRSVEKTLLTPQKFKTTKKTAIRAFPETLMKTPLVAQQSQKAIKSSTNQYLTFV